MNYITHSLGGAGVGLAVVAMTLTSPVDKITGTAIMAGAVLGSLFPDIDHRQSWIGHKVPIASSITAGLFKHRGFIHTPVFIFIMTVVLSVVSQVLLDGEQQQLATEFIYGFIPGMISHIILDTLNVQGISWLWPLSSKKLHLLPIRTNSMFEAVVTVALAILIIGEYKLLFA